jgi:hypothetical protein
VCEMGGFCDILCGIRHGTCSGLPIADPHRMPFLVRYFIDMGWGT